MDVPSYNGLNAVVTDQNIYKIICNSLLYREINICSVGLRENVI